MEPKIRLKGFSGEWKETSLGKLSTNYKYGINAAATPYDGANKYLRITDIDENTRVFSQDNLTSPGTDLSSCNEYLLEDGDIAVARTGASVGKSYIYHPSDGKVYFAGFLIRARLNENVDKDCVFYNTLTDKYAKYIRLVSQRSGQPGVNVEELKGYTLNLPCDKNEQKALGAYFQHLDSLIQSTAKKIESLKQVKAASLQAMFPQEGETVPRVRFKGFEEEWEKVSFYNIFTFVKNNSYSRDQLSESQGEVMNIHYGDVLIKFGDVVDAKKDSLPYVKGLSQKSKQSISSALQDGDIIIADAAEDNTVGKCSEIINVGEECIVAGLHTIPCRPILKFTFGYLGHYINSNSFHNQLLPLIQGSKISSISKSVLKLTTVMYPSIEEQQQIASYFTDLDSQITLQAQRLAKLKQIKSACLDNMFV